MKIYKLIEKYIKNNKLNRALKTIINHAEYLSLSNTETAGSQQLDDYCSQIGNINHSEITGNNGPTVFIATTLYKTGGHSKCLKDLIQLHGSSPCVILLTNVDGRCNIKLIESLYTANNVKIIIAPPGSPLKKLSFIQETLARLQPKTIFLFNHSHDALSIAAISSCINSMIYFYHHANFRFTLGLYSSNTTVIELTPYNYSHSFHELAIKNLIYFPLFSNNTASPDFKVKNINCLNTASCAASAEKISRPCLYQFTDIIPFIMNQSKGIHVHFGQLPYFIKRKIYRNLQYHKISKNNFINIPWTPNLPKALNDYDIDIYINSFPIGGGLALVEAMGAGKAILSHKYINNDKSSQEDILGDTAYYWSTPDDIKNIFSSLSSQDIIQHGQKAYQRYLSSHGFEYALKLFAALQQSNVEMLCINNADSTLTKQYSLRSPTNSCSNKLTFLLFLKLACRRIWRFLFT